jgi:zinc protease
MIFHSIRNLIKKNKIKRFAKIATFILVFFTPAAPAQSLDSISMMSDNPPAHQLSIEQWTNPNGVRVYFVNAPSLPMLDIKVVFNAGSARDNEKPGTALLTNAMLDEGAGALSADAIANQFATIGAQFNSQSARDMAFLELRTLSNDKTLAAAIPLLSNIIQSPSFPQKSLTRIKNQLLFSLKKQQQLPRSIASKAFFSTLYNLHPYGSPVDGNEKSIAAITRQDLVNLYQQFYVGNNAVIALVGDIDRDTAEKISLQLTSLLPDGNAASPLPIVASLPKAITKHIEFDSTQTHILIGAPTITRADPDYVALYVANHILGGGGLGSILMEEIREKRGLAYVAASDLTAMLSEGPFIINLQTRNDQADEALTITKDTLKNFISKGPTEDQLKKAKLEISGQFPLSIADNASIADHIASIGFYRLPITYYSDFISKVNALSQTDITAALARHIHLDQLATITVGKKSD